VDHLVKQPAEINQLQDISTDLYYYCYYQQQEQGQLLPNFDEQQQPQQQPQQQQQRRYHNIFCPIASNNVSRPRESQHHAIMFDTHIIEEFGNETPKVKELAKKMNVNYKFENTTMQMYRTKRNTQRASA
jgi:hypothetical protein